MSKVGRSLLVSTESDNIPLQAFALSSQLQTRPIHTPWNVKLLWEVATMVSDLGVSNKLVSNETTKLPLQNRCHKNFVATNSGPYFYSILVVWG